MQRHMSQEVIGTMYTDRLREAVTARRRAHGSAYGGMAEMRRRTNNALAGHL